MGSNVVTPPILNSHSSDDEILGLLTHLPRKFARVDPARANSKSEASSSKENGQSEFAFDENDSADQNRSVTNQKSQSQPANQSSAARTDAKDPAERGSENGALAHVPAQDEPEHLREALDANPELRDAWQDAAAYRDSFPTPEQARDATALLGDLNRMDALFFSRRPEDHAELARAVAQLDPAAFSSLSRAMADLANKAAQQGIPEPSAATAQQDPATGKQNLQANLAATSSSAGLTPTQVEFFHSTNAAAVQSVLEAIETQVERLLPDGISKSARNRVVGEIYREMDTTLRGNRGLEQQMREAFRSGALDDSHQRAIVSLVTGRARQALPAVAKRVLNEWTTTVVSANHERRTRQRTAERRVDIAGSGGAGNDGHRALSSRDVDYARMSDADILNL
jgi:hypothetical protein